MYPKTFQNLIRHFSSLPSVGPKMAERLVLHLFKQDPEILKDFAHNLEKLTELNQCKICYNVCENGTCVYCADPKRETDVVAVVEDALDVIAIERTGVFHGRYHVLGGTIGPVRGGNTNNLTIEALTKRIGQEHIREIILAMNPTTEGDMTALYLKQKLSSLGVKITRLAKGLSTGGDIEYADEETLGAALKNRS